MTSVVDNPATYIAAVQAEYCALPCYFETGDETFIRVHLGPDPVAAAAACENLSRTLAEAVPAIVAASSFVLPMTVEQAVDSVKDWPATRFACLQGTNPFELAEHEGECQYCGKKLKDKAFRCLACEDVRISCASCEAEKVAGMAAVSNDDDGGDDGGGYGDYASRKPELDACQAAGHVRDVLSFADVPIGEICNLCYDHIGAHDCWIDMKSGNTVCVTCADTQAGKDHIARMAERIIYRRIAEARGLNEALGLGCLSSWIPVLRGVDKYKRTQDLDDLDDSDDGWIDNYNEYCRVWVNLDPAARYPVMISVGDDHGREGFFGLSQALAEVLHTLQEKSPVRIIYDLNFPIHYG